MTIQSLSDLMICTPGDTSLVVLLVSILPVRYMGGFTAGRRGSLPGDTLPSPLRSTCMSDNPCS